MIPLGGIKHEKEKTVQEMDINDSGELNVIWNERKFMDLMEEENNINNH
jgi:hypothetical protein